MRAGLAREVEEELPFPAVAEAEELQNVLLDVEVPVKADPFPRWGKALQGVGGDEQGQANPTHSDDRMVLSLLHQGAFDEIYHPTHRFPTAARHSTRSRPPGARVRRHGLFPSPGKAPPGGLSLSPRIPKLPKLYLYFYGQTPPACFRESAFHPPPGLCPSPAHARISLQRLLRAHPGVPSLQPARTFTPSTPHPPRPVSLASRLHAPLKRRFIPAPFAVPFLRPDCAVPSLTPLACSPCGTVSRHLLFARPRHPGGHPPRFPARGEKRSVKASFYLRYAVGPLRPSRGGCTVVRSGS